MGRIKRWWVKFNWPKWNPEREVFLQEIGPVDRSIAPHIVKLNNSNFKTIYSCSGLLRDHSFDCNSNHGYILFRAWKWTKKYKKIASAAKNSGLFFEENFSKITVRNHEPDDSKKLHLWNLFVANLTQENR